ncbi:DUF4097 family beta strand repeat-containing protein [Nonomuraea rhizosphaerae]|uniref:DUF4097 family beta strand repeat-containing protein n=1 Tax=Nonomuraea rhizosphaerae TaxID=2665663 RepID=UPI001C5E01A6|nr:DUF4097 family beta strand repeat-containing protein [Nonomuraea rhizosphaerae]
MRALWLISGALATVFALLLGTGLLWAGFAKARPPTEYTRRVIPFKLSELRLMTGAGGVNVMIAAGEAGELVLERSLRWSEQRPTVDEPWDGKTLTLDASCPDTHREQPPICDADYTLFVPMETDIEATSVNGLISVNSLYGDVTLTSESGDLEVSDATGTVHVRSGSGSVRGRQLTSAQTDVETGSGRVDLSFDAAPTKVRAVVRTKGNVSLMLPHGPYDVTAEAKESEITVDKDPTSPRKVIIDAKRGFALVWGI